VCECTGSAQIRIEESSEAEYRSPFEGAWISRVIAAECPRSVSCGSTSVVVRVLSVAPSERS
jgi:hypothetical protein